MTSEAQAPAAESGPARGVVRVLIPVLLNLVILALMIHIGLERNRDRIRAGRSGLDKAIRMVSATCDKAARSLASRQDADGSWPYDRSTSPSLERYE